MSRISSIVDARVEALFRFLRSTETPSRAARIRVAIIIGCIAAWGTYFRHLQFPSHPTDFGQLWFGARALIEGANPYVLVGFGKVYDWPWELYYPAPAMVAVIPFTILPELAAAMTFVGISSALLAYGVTVDGWFRLLMFVTPAFTIAAGAAQWSPLFTASLCLPWIGAILVAKPNIGSALVVAGPQRLFRAALLGGVVLTTASFLLLPEWPRYWIENLRSANHFAPPIVRLGGPLVLFALLRWRRREAWLIVALACVRQTTYWYEALPLFLIPQNFMQTLALAGSCSAGYLLERLLVTTTDSVLNNQQVGALLVAFAYLPATVLVLMQPNEGPLPWWLAGLNRLRRGRASPARDRDPS